MEVKLIEYKRPTPVQLALLLGLFFFLMGCGDADFRAEAVGPDAQLTVIMDSMLWKGPVGDAVREHIGTPISTLPSPEASFDLKQFNLQSQRQFEQLKKFKNVVFIAPLSDTTNEAKYLSNILSEEARQAVIDGGSAVVPRDDEWFRRQKVFYIIAPDHEGLISTISEEGANIRYQYDLSIRQRVYRDMFDRGRQHELESRLMRDHQFAVNAQHDFQIAIDTTNFVWLRRILPDTWRSIFVYYEERASPADLTPEWIYSTRDSLAQLYLQSDKGNWVEVDRRRPLYSEEINFKDRYAYETRGLWHMVGEEDGDKIQVGMGGPFLTYAFYDQPSGRLYLVDGMVFAPNYPKREFMRHMEVIAYTFRTQEEMLTEVASRN